MSEKEDADVLETAYLFKHYLWDGVVPVRVLFSRLSGLKAGAQVLDRSSGTLRFDNKWLRKIEEDPWVEEIDRARFNAVCAKIQSGYDSSDS